MPGFCAAAFAAEGSLFAAGNVFASWVAARCSSCISNSMSWDAVALPVAGVFPLSPVLLLFGSVGVVVVVVGAVLDAAFDAVTSGAVTLLVPFTVGSVGIVAAAVVSAAGFVPAFVLLVPAVGSVLLAPEGAGTLPVVATWLLSTDAEDADGD